MRQRIPDHYLEELRSLRAPILAVAYTGDSPDVTCDGTTLTLVEGAKTFNISLSGKASDAVAGEINRSELAYRAWPLAEITDMGTVGLELLANDTTTDGALLLRGTGHVLRELEQSRIRLLPPHDEDRHLPWYVRVDRGHVVREVDGASWRFHIPESGTETYSARYGRPYVDVVDAEPQRLGERSLLLPRAPVLYEPGNITLSVRGAPQGARVIRDVDELNGVVYLSQSYPEDTVLRVSYTYEERAFVYRGIDLNPSEFHNPQVLDRYVVFYLLPSSGPSRELRTDVVRHSEGPSLYGAVLSIPRTDEPILLLGAIQVRHAVSKDQLDVVDTRRPGGGVPRERLRAALARTEHVRTTTDHGRFDGLPYPGGAAIVAEVPQSLRDVLDDQEVRARIRQHAAFGSYMVVEFV